jgi:hypothetical protein
MTFQTTVSHCSHKWKLRQMETVSHSRDQHRKATGTHSRDGHSRASRKISQGAGLKSELKTKNQKIGCEQHGR